MRNRSLCYEWSQQRGPLRDALHEAAAGCAVIDFTFEGFAGYKKKGLHLSRMTQYVYLCLVHSQHGRHPRPTSHVF